MIDDANNLKREVFLIGMTGQVTTLLDRLGVLRLVKSEHKVNSRLDALKSAEKLIA